MKSEAHTSVVTHQWSGDPSILAQIDAELKGSRNSPMIWWPFNKLDRFIIEDLFVVTHQWSGDPSISLLSVTAAADIVVTHQWSGDPSIAVNH